MWGFTFSRLARCRGGRQRGSNQQDKPGFPRKKSIIRGTMGGFVRQNREDWMRLHTRWSGLVCAACLVLLIVIRYCCIEVLLKVIVLPASYHQKVLASKKKSSVWLSWEYWVKPNIFKESPSHVNKFVISVSQHVMISWNKLVEDGWQMLFKCGSGLSILVTGQQGIAVEWTQH